MSNNINHIKGNKMLNSCIKCNQLNLQIVKSYDVETHKNPSLIFDNIRTNKNLSDYLNNLKFPMQTISICHTDHQVTKF